MLGYTRGTQNGGDGHAAEVMSAVTWAHASPFKPTGKNCDIAPGALPGRCSRPLRRGRVLDSRPCCDIKRVHGIVLVCVGVEDRTRQFSAAPASGDAILNHEPMPGRTVPIPMF